MKKNDLISLWSETKEFLSAFTNADINNPWSIHLKIYPIFDRRKFDENLENIITVSERPNPDPIWTVANENLEKVVSGLQNVQQYLPKQPNAIELEIWYDFRFVDTTNFIELPSSECDSYIKFIFSKKHSCSPCLIFPFSEPTSEFWKYLDEIKPKLPFELNEKLLRKIYVKNGSPSSSKKIARP
jgi:hypothetical protein